jgi:uncharacterized membrane protein
VEAVTSDIVTALGVFFTALGVSLAVVAVVGVWSFLLCYADDRAQR